VSAPALGFTVPELVAAGRGGASLRMGLRRVPEDAWLWPAADRAARAAAFAADPDAVAVLPRAVAAGREAAAAIGVAGGLAEAARACWEDLCLVQQDADGRPVLTGGAVAFPTDWRLSDKLGLSLAAVHAPIHGYAEQLAAGVDHLVATIAPGPVWGRANWFVVPTEALAYRPVGDPARRFAHVGAANAGDTLFVRCERQTLRRLPKTGAVLFTIGIAVQPLAALPAATVRRVADAVATVPAGEGDRRAAPFYLEALAAYADRREKEQP
jgi:dimethylamine monooxygenase subunit A